MSFINNLKSPRKILFVAVCLISVISAFIFLITLKSNNRKFNQNLLSNTLSLYTSHLEMGSVINEKVKLLDNILLPFKVVFLDDKSSKIKYQYLENENKLMINKGLDHEFELENILQIIKNFGVFEKGSSISSDNKNQNLTSNSVLNPSPIISSKINFYKHINLFFLVHPEEEKNEYQHPNYLKIIKQLKLPKQMNIYMKFLIYDKFKGVINADDFYKDLKNYNSKIVFEELTDESSLNILLLNDKKRFDSKESSFEIDVFYNKDINNDIYVFPFKQSFNVNMLEKIINTRMLPNEIKELVPSDFLDTLITLYNSKNVIYSKMLIESLYNLEKINRIFPLYESIRTIENVKEKLNSIQNNLITIVKHNFNISDIELVIQIFIDVKYLMESNELVSYEHYFSNEFK